MPKKDKKNRITLFKKVNFLVFFLLFIFTIIFVLKTTPISPLVADYVLRPLLGSKQTIKAESIYFMLSEEIRKLQYTFTKPTNDVFVANVKTISVEKELNDDLLDVQPLPIDTALSPLKGEGVWESIPQVAFPNEVVMARTFVRPDSTKPYAITALVIMDMKKLALGTEAGTYYPGGTHNVFGPGIVPKNIQQTNQLLAVFNSGFQEKDGHYGMTVGERIYVPLRDNLATLVMHTNGSIEMINYHGQSFDNTVASIRQNGQFLIKDGVITPFVESGDDTWGRTTTNSFYTWRSGIGITKDGNLIYAVGSSLLPGTLATALKEAGAVNAMQLDINPYWVRFILFRPLGNAEYSYTPLIKDMENGGYAYLHGYNKDFFYVYKKTQ